MFAHYACNYSGWKFALSSIPALQNSGSYSLSGFQARLIRYNIITSTQLLVYHPLSIFSLQRWGRLRVSMITLPALLEPFTECLLLGVIVSLSVYYIMGWDKLIFLLCHCLNWFICDMILLHLVEVYYKLEMYYYVLYYSLTL